MKVLHIAGTKSQKRQAEAITPRKEDVLQTLGQLSMQSSQSLLNTIYYYNSKLFGLRAKKHRALQCKQFKLGEDKDGCYNQFLGRSSKSLDGGLKQRKINCKNICHYVTSRGSDRDLFCMYDKYLQAIGKKEYFYKRHLKMDN